MEKMIQNQACKQIDCTLFQICDFWKSIFIAYTYAWSWLGAEMEEIYVKWVDFVWWKNLTHNNSKFSLSQSYTRSYNQALKLTFFIWCIRGDIDTHVATLSINIGLRA